MKYLFCILFFVCVSLTSSHGQSQLYAATGFAGSTGELYILNPADGSVITDVGPLNDLQGHNYGLTGLRYDASSGILYGITGSSLTSPNSLVIVDPDTALVTYIGGPFGSRLSDIAIDPFSFIMFGVSGSSKYFYTVDKLTGLAVRIGDTTLPPKRGGGLAETSRGVVYGTNDGSLYTYDKITGVATAVGTLNLASFVDALAFSPSNTLYGIEGGGTVTGDGAQMMAEDPETWDNTDMTGDDTDAGGSDPNSNRERWLVLIDTTTGAATELGYTVGNLNALAFIPAP